MTSESWKETPHAVYMYEPDVSDFLNELKEVNKTFEKKITVNTAKLKAMSEGIKAAPHLNAHIRFYPHLVGGSITEFDNIDVSLPYIMPDGCMMTIKIPDVGNKSMSELKDYMDQVAARINNTDLTEAMYSVSFENTMNALKKGRIFTVICRYIGAKIGKSKIIRIKGKAKRDYYKIPETQRLTKEDIRQGTVTISNVGSVMRVQRGALTFLDIIPPQIFAIGLGAIQKKPIVITDEQGNDSIAIRQIMPICLAFDHRALDFDHLIPFLQRLDDIFANPKQILEWY
jgi:pyruvate dehydrogenase E2 component (dihydrolipoamide acetyltransferase)